MAKDFCMGYEDDDTAVVSFYHCSKCGRSYEITEPNKEERDSEYAAYWKGGDRC